MIALDFVLECTKFKAKIAAVPIPRSYCAKYM